MQRGLTNFFENFINKGSLFTKKAILQSTHIPGTINHRDDQINQIAKILAPSLKLETPSNLFLYGKTGTGKTLSIHYVLAQMKNVAVQNKIPFDYIYINCKMKKIADTEYRLVAQLAREMGKSIPPTGLPTDEVYNIFYSALNSKNSTIILVLDEIDQLVKKNGDEILYNLTRINAELSTSKISIVGISNDLVFVDTLDPRIKSSLSEEEVLFPPYNALQLQSILRERADMALKPGVLEEGVIEKCAAYAAREHGDARRALELLRVAAEVAERENSPIVMMSHIDVAEDKIERERILDVVQVQPKQTQAILFSVLLFLPGKRNDVVTGQIYENYKKVCYKINMRPLTIRRVSDILGELEMFGLIETKTISKGRYGRTREIGITVPSHLRENIEKILKNSLEIHDA